MNIPSPEAEQSQAVIQSGTSWIKWLQVAGLVYLLLVAVAAIGGGFKLAAGDEAKELFAFASNPIAALVVGILATSLIQSSSTVTSIIVGLVAGGLPVHIAIPMVMGANIGTTITNTIVSLGHIRKGKEFKRAFAAATVHDFFNLISVVIFLPLEIMFGLLEKVGGYLASLFVGTDSLSIKGFNFLKPIVKPPVKFIENNVLGSFSDITTGVIMAVFGVVLIFIVITLIGKLLKALMVGKAKNIFHKAVGRGPVTGVGSGALMTVLVQSSSTTTSLLVPLAGTGVFTLRQVYPFTLGANIGTCITALLAATAVSGDNAIFALQIALVHLVYNSLAVVVIYGAPMLRELPIKAAEKLAELAVANKGYALLYIGVVFFLVPFVLIGIGNMVSG